MKRFSSAIAVCMLVSSAVAFAANGNGSGAGNEGVAIPGPAAQPMEQNMFVESEGKPAIAGDGIQNATQVDSPSDIGRDNATANDSPEPVPTVGDVGNQNAQ